MQKKGKLSRCIHLLQWPEIQEHSGAGWSESDNTGFIRHGNNAMKLRRNSVMYGHDTAAPRHGKRQFVYTNKV